MLGTLELDAALQVGSHQSRTEWQTPLPPLLPTLPWMQPWKCLPFWAAITRWVVLSCSSTNPPNAKGNIKHPIKQPTYCYHAMLYNGKQPLCSPPKATSKFWGQKHWINCCSRLCMKFRFNWILCCWNPWGHFLSSSRITSVCCCTATPQLRPSAQHTLYLTTLHYLPPLSSTKVPP